MKVVSRLAPLFTRAVRVCDDEGRPLFVCLVTTKGWLGRIAWVWMGLGRMDLEIRSALTDELIVRGHQFVEFERLKGGNLSQRRYPLRASDKRSGFNWPIALTVLAVSTFYIGLLL